jgi:hypothetical protein
MFDALKYTYDGTRGRLRRWLSVWQYDHCEFFVFNKWGVKLGGPLYQGFPSSSDDLYDFDPHPPSPFPPHGPISQGEFRDHYYRNKRRSFLAPFSRRSSHYFVFGGTNKDALLSLPKKVQQTEFESEKRGLF